MTDNTIVYKWEVSRLDCYPSHNGETDVVFTVHYRRHATDGTHTTSIYGAVAVLYKDGEAFIPFADLTLAVVTGWVEDALGAEAVTAQEAVLTKMLAEMANPPVVFPPLPWAA